MQNQLVCCGCRHFLVYPRGASNVRCSICNTINSVVPPATETAHLVCMGCRTLLMYPPGATSVRCACCHTINDVRTANPIAQVSCSRCHTTLAYPSGAPSVKCALCHYITNVGVSNMRVPNPIHRPNGATPSSLPSTSASMPRSHTQTVVVENPMTMDESGKLVSNVVVGVTAEKR